MKNLTFFGLLAISGLASAADLGIQGTAYPIIEPDMRSRMMRDVAKVDWTQIEKDRGRSTKSYFERLSPYEFPYATKTETQWIEPSLILAADLKTLVKKPDGTIEWQILYQKGTKVNPLEKVRPVERMLFFDGRSEEQVAFVREAIREEPLRIMPVLTAGNPSELGKLWSRPVFFANQTLIDKFKIKATPTLVGVGDDSRALYLAVTTFASPYRRDYIKSAWFGIGEAAK